MAWRESANFGDLTVDRTTTFSGAVTAGTVNATTAAATTVNSTTVATTNLTHNSRVVPGTITFTPAAGAENVCEVTIKICNSAGTAIAGVYNFDVWLSDAASGAGLTGTAASGTVTVKSASGAVIGTYEAKKALRVQTLATGIFILEITDSAKTGYRVCAQINDLMKVSAALVSGNYGSA